jgi:hypothetical protein
MRLPPSSAESQSTAPAPREGAPGPISLEARRPAVAVRVSLPPANRTGSVPLPNRRSRSAEESCAHRFSTLSIVHRFVACWPSASVIDHGARARQVLKVTGDVLESIRGRVADKNVGARASRRAGPERRAVAGDARRPGHRVAQRAANCSAHGGTVGRANDRIAQRRANGASHLRPDRHAQRRALGRAHHILAVGRADRGAQRSAVSPSHCSAVRRANGCAHHRGAHRGA